jgi:hypothetical protein
MALADDLVFAQDFRAGSGSTALSLQGDTGTLSGAAPPTWDAADGGSLRFNGGGQDNSYVTYGAIASTQDLWNRTSPAPFSVFVRMYNDNLGGNMVSRENGADDGHGWQFELGSSAPQFGIAKTSTGAPRFNYINLATIPSIQNVWVNVGFSDPGTLTNGSEQLYTAGTLRTSTNTGPGSGASGGSDASDAFVIGRGRLQINANNKSFDGRIACVYVWRRALSGAEFAALEVDPFQLFGPTPYLIIGTAKKTSSGTTALATDTDFGAAVTGDLILAAVSSWRSGMGVTFTAPTDNAGNTYTQIGVTQNEVSNVQMALFASVATAGTAGSPLVVTSHLSPSTYTTLVAWLVRPTAAVVYNGDVAQHFPVTNNNNLDPTTSPAPPGVSFFLCIASDLATDDSLTEGTDWNQLGVNGFTSAMRTAAKYGTRSSTVALYTEYQIASVAKQGLWVDTADNFDTRLVIVASFGPVGGDDDPVGYALFFL